MMNVTNNMEEAKALSVELQKEISRLRTVLSKLENNIVLVQSGENWNGANAYEINKALNGHLDVFRSKCTSFFRITVSIFAVDDIYLFLH